MKIAILGFGKEGQSALEYWSKPGNQLTVCDQTSNIDVPQGVNKQLGPDYLKNLDQFDLLVRSPGLYPGDISKANPDSSQILSKVTTVTNELLAVSPSKNIIDVTGTKGKGTTSTLIAKFLETAGKTVHLGGNIGLPVLEMLKAGIQPDDWLVIELSSFQLIDIKHAPPIAVCVMVVPEHLNWHADMDEYIQAKQQLFKLQSKDDLAVFNRASEHSKEVAGVSPGRKISYEVPGPGAEPQLTTGAYLKADIIYMDGAEVCKAGDVALLGRHNLENVCAAVAATWEIIGKDPAVIKKVVSEFKGLPHHLEFARELNGVSYYCDSFGTTPETAIVAIQAFEQPKVMILGGSDKQASFDDLAQVVASHNVRSAVLIGETAPKIEKALRTAGFEHIVTGGKDMTGIVQTAQKLAQNGDIVLLSPACASFGLFKNYKDRGEQFMQAVQALQ